MEYYGGREVHAALLLTAANCGHSYGQLRLTTANCGQVGPPPTKRHNTHDNLGLTLSFLGHNIILSALFWT